MTTTTAPPESERTAVAAGPDGSGSGVERSGSVGATTGAGDRPARPARLPYIAALDGVRGVAVLAVVLFHAGASWMPGGFLGVSTFFTLSGFLITSLLLTERAATGRVDLGRFWSRRVRRLLPAAALTVILVAIAGRLLLAPAMVDRLRGDLVAVVLYVANWRFLLSGDSYADLFAAPSPVLHFWSLAIEEQFYLIYPLILWAVFRLVRWSVNTLMWVIATLTMASILLPLVVSMTPDRIYYGTDTRAAELLLGALLAVVVRTPAVRRPLVSRRGVQRTAAAVGVVAFFACAACWVWVDQRDDGLYRGGFALYATLTSAVLLAAILPVGVSPIARLLSWAPLRLLGVISYGVYLYHWPVFLVLDGERTGWSFWPLLLARMAVTMGLACLSYAAVEHPIRTGRRRAPSRVLVAVPATATVLVLMVWFTVPTVDPGSLVSFGSGSGAPPAEVQSALEAVPPGPAPMPTDGAVPVATSSPPAPQRVLVVGTPNASDFAAGFADWVAGQSAGQMVVDTAISDCGSGRGEIGLEFRTDQSTCAGWAATWGDRLKSTKPDTVVLLQPLVNTQLVALTPEVLQREGGAVADLLGSTGARLVAVTVPGQSRDRYGFDDMVRKVAEAAGTLAPPVDDLAAEDPFPTLAARVAAARPPAPAPEAAPARRVLIIGDSVASNLGRALELWGKRTGSAVVWNAAQVGCGLAEGGTTDAEPPYNTDRAVCRDWRASWSEKVAAFRPDIVLVLTGAWDLPGRARPEWGNGYRHVGDPEFDRWLLSSYQRAADTLGSTGATVVWMTAPCTGQVWAGYAISGTGAFDNDRIDALNTRILPELSGVTELDLAAKVCPGGVFEKDIGGVSDARPDGLHFTDDAALWVADWLGPALIDRVAASTENRDGGSEPTVPTSSSAPTGPEPSASGR